MTTTHSRADALKGIAQFLTDAVTAAGLLSHGRTDKKLATRIHDQADELRKHIHLLAAFPVEQPTTTAADELREKDTIIFRGDALTLSGAQLLEALDFMAPDRDRDQLESELTFRRGEGHAGDGMYCWLTEYPEEGALFVDGSTTVPTEAAPAPEDERAEGVDGLAHEVWSAAQLAPGEGIEDAVQRIGAILCRSPALAAEAVAWAAVHFGGERDGKVYTTCDTKAEVDQYIARAHQSSDATTLTARPIAFADAAPQPVSIPAGWKAMPPSATMAMRMAMAQAAADYMQRTGGNSPDAIYEAGFAAAPQPAQADALAEACATGMLPGTHLEIIDKAIKCNVIGGEVDGIDLGGYLDDLRYRFCAPADARRAQAGARVGLTDEQQSSATATVPTTEYSYANVANAERWHGRFDSIPAAIAEALGEYGKDPDRVVYVGENKPVEISYDSLADEVIERVEEQVYEQVGEVADTVGPFDAEQTKPLADSIKQWVEQHADINCWRVENIKGYGPGTPEYEAARALLQGANHAE
ncbi:hypothetical protein [Burkholderia cepacia]|uniref:hypothetical protein n=1 Tax=Burkholderia cepacia TaxID=292 RepID=UPI001588BA36|nr:hypothetical protein [Burkholderia cepacia]MCA8054351.1 hypothetical protein [Burkholderia cepacia]